jgi:UDP-N-acetylglucosamine--N-acetylmuramyl-(pentapeptide) pyrophosphoryl-undecaprenol N-acetylglucosamine transferase
MKKKKIVIAGGGTGGHVFAAIEIAKAWNGGAHFIGAYGGLEGLLVPKAGFPITLLRLSSLNRVSWKTRLLTLVRMPGVLFKILRLLRKLKPDVVFGIGGYASGPVLLVGKLLRIKTVILEQNAVCGFANKISLMFCDCVFTGFPIQLPHPRVTFVGNPVRSVIQKTPLIVEPFTILVVGGSQGALGLNRLMRGVQKQLEELPINWVHQVGKRDSGMPGSIRVKQIDFIEDIQAYYQQATLVIARAGALTISELAKAGKPAIFVPLPTAANDHQRKNACLLLDKQACYLFEQDDDPQKLVDLILNLFQNRLLLEELQERIQQFYYPDAARMCCKLMYELI